MILVVSSVLLITHLEQDGARVIDDVSYPKEGIDIALLIVNRDVAISSEIAEKPLLPVAGGEDRLILTGGEADEVGCPNVAVSVLETRCIGRKFDEIGVALCRELKHTFPESVNHLGIQWMRYWWITEIDISCGRVELEDTDL
jgi:hypothetical protein